MTTTEEIKKGSLQFLRKLYELSGGDESKGLDMSRIGEEFWFDSDLTGDIIDYLLEERLIVTTIGGGSTRITHEGIQVVEDT